MWAIWVLIGMAAMWGYKWLTAPDVEAIIEDNNRLAKANRRLLGIMSEREEEG